MQYFFALYKAKKKMKKDISDIMQKASRPKCKNFTHQDVSQSCSVSAIRPKIECNIV